MFKNDLQQARACSAIVNLRPRTAGMWTESGPTSEAAALFDTNGGTLSSGERVLLMAAFAVWNGRGDARISDLLKLDNELLEAVGSLLVAIAQHSESQGPETTGTEERAIDAWIERWSQHHLHG